MYLDQIAALIKKHIPEGRLPKDGSSDLLRIYAVLLRAKGTTVTQSDIHDAWSAWMAERNSAHESLVEYESLSEEVKDEDRIFTTAIKNAAMELGLGNQSKPSIVEVLFPHGPPNSSSDSGVIDLYKMMVDSSERLVGRRQAVNTFFLTINGALLTAFGVIVQSTGDERLSATGIVVLAIAGAVLSLAWRSLIKSFGQLNSGKFRVINTLERYLPAAIYEAEWEALGRGENPDVYRSFTSREIWVPNALLTIHVATAIVGFLVAVGCISFGLVGSAA